jgi:hypothetical protein
VQGLLLLRGERAVAVSGLHAAPVVIVHRCKGAAPIPFAHASLNTRLVAHAEGDNDRVLCRYHSLSRLVLAYTDHLYCVLLYTTR